MTMLRSRSALLVDVVLAVVLSVAAAVDLAGRPGAPQPWAVLIGVSWMGFLALRSSAPLVAVVGMSAGTVAYATLSHVPPSGGLWSFIALLVISFTVGSRLSGARRWVGGSVLLACVYALQIADAHFPGGSDDAADVYVAPLVLVGGPLLAGALLARERRQASELRRLQAELQVEREARLVDARRQERAHIARELHDVIAHSVSVMVIQAGAAELLLAPDASARAPLHEVRTTGKQALVELRRQLGVLRDGELEPFPVPIPTLEDLRRLAGPDVDLEWDVRVATDLPAGVAQTAYRVVQEALTNARRHAAGAAISVRVRQVRDGLDLEVVNSAGRSRDGLQAPGSGHGLLGMSERVGLYGGLLDTGPTADGGWRVRARFPAADIPEPASRPA